MHRQKRKTAGLCQPEAFAQEMTAKLAAIKQRLFTTTLVDLTSACHQIRECRALTVREAASLLGLSERTEQCDAGTRMT